MSTVSAVFRLIDLCIEVESDTSRVSNYFRETLRYKGATAGAPSRLQANLKLDFSTQHSPIPIPEQAQHLGPTEHGELDIWKAGARMFLTHGEATVVALDPKAGVAQGTLSPALAAAPEKRRDPLFYLITFSLVILLRYQSRFALHAAALARDGQSALLVARSDSGKSTAALNLVREGWSYLSDDAVLLRRQGSSVRAHSFRSDFCVDPEAVDQFPELAGYAWPPSLSDPTKWRVDPAKLYPGQFVPRCTPQVLVMPEIVDAAESTLEPMDPTVMLGHLANQSGLLLTPEPEIASQHLNLLKQLVNQTASYRFLAGRDQLKDSSSIDRLLKSVLSVTRNSSIRD